MGRGRAEAGHGKRILVGAVQAHCVRVGAVRASRAGTREAQEDTLQRQSGRTEHVPSGPQR